MNYYNKRLNLTAEPANSLTLHYRVMIGGSFNLIHKSLIEGSADWVRQPDWVITAFKYDDSDIIKVLGDDGLYHGSVFTYTLDELQVSKAQIHSVRRSDGVEFKVGDKVELGVIEKFEINKKKMCVILDKHAAAFEIDSPFIQHAPAVLFTTEDGVDITDGETVVYCVEHRNDYNIETLKSGDANLQVDGKWFSTRKAAENYIAENKPLYSLADIRKAWGECGYFHEDYFLISEEELIKQLKQVK